MFILWPDAYLVREYDASLFLATKVGQQQTNHLFVS